MKKLKYFLEKNDWIWSVPVGFASFILFAVIGQLIMTPKPTLEEPNPDPYMGFYSPEFLHAAIYAGLLMVFANMVVQLGMRFNFKTVHSYIYEGAKDDFKQLPKWLKIFLSLFLYIFYFLAFLKIWEVLV